jgi:hypothetical protein
VADFGELAPDAAPAQLLLSDIEAAALGTPGCNHLLHAQEQQQPTIPDAATSDLLAHVLGEMPQGVQTMAMCTLLIQKVKDVQAAAAPAQLPVSSWQEATQQHQQYLQQQGQPPVTIPVSTEVPKLLPAAGSIGSSSSSSMELKWCAGRVSAAGSSPTPPTPDKETERQQAEVSKTLFVLMLCGSVYTHCCLLSTSCPAGDVHVLCAAVLRNQPLLLLLLPFLSPILCPAVPTAALPCQWTDRHLASGNNLLLGISQWHTDPSGPCCCCAQHTSSP